MLTAGFVLAGGASSRMGRNKAFLMLGGRMFVQIVTAAVLETAGNVTIVGRPDMYRHLGFPVIPDVRPNAGPLAGIETALRHTTTDWNLIVACDMPRVTAVALHCVLDEALAHPDAGCVLPQSAEGFVEPLCAVYNRRILPEISRALLSGIHKVTDALPPSTVHCFRMTGEAAFQNINTPEELRLATERS